MLLASSSSILCCQANTRPSVGGLDASEPPLVLPEHGVIGLGQLPVPRDSPESASPDGISLFAAQLPQLQEPSHGHLTIILPAELRRLSERRSGQGALCVIDGQALKGWRRTVFPQAHAQYASALLLFRWVFRKLYCLLPTAEGILSNPAFRCVAFGCIAEDAVL